MNPFAEVSWIWKALRRRSVTFAALFASALLGFSLVHGLRTVLGALGVGWFGLLIFPLVIVSVVARKESEWMPDERQRRRWSRGLILGSVAIAIVTASLTSKHREAETSPAGTSPPLRPHGPPGK